MPARSEPAATVPVGGQDASPYAANRLQLVASLIEREALRYTPAGVPILGMTLQHRSEVVEAGVRRQVEMTLTAIAAGTLSGQLERRELGYVARFAGFLAPLRRNTRTLIFHITELQDIEKD